jgi:hypothetical protein
MSTAAARQRARRRRQRLGLVQLLVEVDEVALAEALIDAGDLQAHEAEDRGSLARGLGRLLGRLLVDVTA